MGFFKQSSFAKAKPLKIQKVGCGLCKLKKKCLSPEITPIGDMKKGIMILNDTPSLNEDKAGIIGMSQSYNTMKTKLRKIGINIEEDCLWINAVACHTGYAEGKSIKPTGKQVDCCRNKVWNTIKKNKPKVIITLGMTPLMSIIGGRVGFKINTMEQWRGFIIPDQETKCFVAPIWHPSFLFGSSDVASIIFDRDLKQIIDALETPFTTINSKDHIQVVKQPKEIVKRLKTLNQFGGDICFDYETTGLKPHAKGHKLISCSYTDKKTLDTFAFPMYSEEVKEEWRKVLKNKRISKSAANAKFEETWGRVQLQTKTYGWVFDTMLAMHIIDNRDGITSVKVQAYLLLGIADYAKHIKPYLRATDLEVEKHGGNAINRIEEIDLDDLLFYNGEDSFYEALIEKWQYKQIGERWASMRETSVKRNRRIPKRRCSK